MKSGIWMIPAAMAAAAGGLARSQYERNHFVVEETRIVSAKIQKPRTLVFLTDLHDKEFGPDNEQLLEAVRSAAPDAVLIGGDTMVTKPGRCDMGVTRRLIAGLTEIAPVYYGDGNHEQRLWRRAKEYPGKYREFLRILKIYKVIYLRNRSALLGEDIRISGLDIDRKYYRKFASAKMEEGYVERRLGTADAGRFQILLAHSPLFFKVYADWGADLSLAGHFHGGTIRLPLLGGVMTPQYHFFLPCCAGTFERGGRRMLVGRGLGTHSINIRFRNLPQVAVIRLEPEHTKQRRHIQTEE